MRDSMSRGKSPRLAISICLFVLTLSSPAALIAQQLGALRAEVRDASTDETPVQAKRKKNRTTQCSHNGLCDCFDDDEGDSILGEAIGQVVFTVASSPWWGPRHLAGDCSLSRGYFADFPYAQLDTGAVDSIPLQFSRPDKWLVRVRAEYGGDLDSTELLSGQLLVETPSRWGLESEVVSRHENTTTPLRGADELWTGDANIIFRFAQGRQLQMRTGIGVNWLSDQLGTDGGLNLTYSGEWFPCQPWVVAGEIDWGTLGSASLFHGRVTAGVLLRRVEMYTGYDHFSVGRTGLNSLVAGLRFWF